MTKRQSGKGSYDREYLEKLIEEAIIDCYNEYEQRRMIRAGSCDAC